MTICRPKNSFLAGRKGTTITLELYRHVMPGMQEDPAAKVDATIRGAIEKDAKNIR